MNEWTTTDGRVDVAEVMSRIREKIRGRRDLGLYTDEEVEEQDVDIENQYYNSKGEQRGALFR